LMRSIGSIWTATFKAMGKLASEGTSVKTGG
jgi:hypothetical protein